MVLSFRHNLFEAHARVENCKFEPYSFHNKES